MTSLILHSGVLYLVQSIWICIGWQWIRCKHRMKCFLRYLDPNDCFLACNNFKHLRVEVTSRSNMYASALPCSLIPLNALSERAVMRAGTWRELTGYPAHVTGQCLCGVSWKRNPCTSSEAHITTSTRMPHPSGQAVLMLRLQLGSSRSQLALDPTLRCAHTHTHTH